MVLKEVEYKKTDRLQKSDAQAIVQIAAKYSSSIIFEWRTVRINAKSLMSVLSMEIKCGDKVMMIVKGADQDNAADNIAQLFHNNFKI